MTVCIAALCDNGQGCVLTSDQMTTAHFPLGYEFESDEIEKIVNIVEGAHVLISGDVLFANEVIEAARQQFRDRAAQGIGDVAEAVRASYQGIRKQRIVRNELEPRGLDLNSYYQAQQRLLMPIVQMIDRAFKEYNPRVEFIVSGKDSSGCHIFTVQNPGDTMCHDPIGFAAIGSGGPHAVYSLIASKYRKSLDQGRVRRLVQLAKTRSEVAPGVGRGTKTVVT